MCLLGSLGRAFRVLGVASMSLFYNIRTILSSHREGEGSVMATHSQRSLPLDMSTCLRSQVPFHGFKEGLSLINSLYLRVEWNGRPIWDELPAIHFVEPRPRALDDCTFALSTKFVELHRRAQCQEVSCMDFSHSFPTHCGIFIYYLVCLCDSLNSSSSRRKMPAEVRSLFSEWLPPSWSLPPWLLP